MSNVTDFTVRSADGTTIGAERVGEGPPVVLIGGAFTDRTTTRALAQVLAPAFTAVSYDRRGRGTSGDEAAPAFAVAREIEDLAALVAELGGDAGSGSGSGDEPAVALFGHSSGAILALEAAAAGVPTRRLALYEAPYVTDDGTRDVRPTTCSSRSPPGRP